MGSVELTGAILEHEVTVLQLVPSHARVFLREPDVDVVHDPPTGLVRRRAAACRALPRAARIGSASASSTSTGRLKRIDATWWPAVEAPAGGDAEPRLGTGWAPIGRPISNSRAYVLDSHREPVPVGAVGELYLAGEGLARGYLHREELTAERFVSGSFGGGQVERAYRTGDLVRYRPDGNLEFVGRIDHQIKIRGFRIELGEIEAALAKHEEVREVAVVAREDRPDDKRLVAYVVPRADTLGLVERLKSKLRERLPDYMLPTHFVFLATFPLTPNGKVDKKSLPAPDPEAVATGTPHVAPRTPTESQIAAIWADALGIASPGIHDNFFDLGGHSLKAAQIVLELRSALRVDAAMRHLFEQPTIAGLAEIMDVLAVADAGATAGGSEREEIEI